MVVACAKNTSSEYRVALFLSEVAIQEETSSMSLHSLENAGAKVQIIYEKRCTKMEKVYYVGVFSKEMAYKQVIYGINRWKNAVSPSFFLVRGETSAW